MDEIAKKIKRKLRDDFVYYAKLCLKIRSEEGNIKPLILNEVQLYANSRLEQQRRETGRVRAIILKGRQQGISTLVEGRFYWLVTNRFGTLAFILTHTADATDNLFEMAKRYHEHCPSAVRPIIEASNAKELIFEGLDSGYKLGTAGNISVGRSSTIQLLHGSEVAFWKNASEHAKGIFQAVPNEKGTEIIIESTAKGVGNYFHQQWQLAESGQSDFIPIFIPWFWSKKYQVNPSEDFKPDDLENDLAHKFNLNPQQLAWRRKKIIELSASGFDGTKSFMQEYPCTPVEAFVMSGEDHFILPNIALDARKSLADAYGPLVIGADPARFGDDRTSIIFRRGRKAYNLLSYHKKDTMEVAGILHSLIIEHKPVKVFIDIGGLGAGVYDRLKELGHGDIIVAVNAGATPLNQARYFNKRAEMWGEMREWLLDGPCQIPDSDSLHADLCGIKYKFDSNSRLVLEKKEDMKKRGIRSPDEADALALTFAYPTMALQQTKNKAYESIAKDMGSGFNNIDRLKKKAYG